MSRVHPEATAADLAAIVSEALEEAGITAVLSGGAAVSIHTDNEYESHDLDFVTAAAIKRIEPVMESLGFKKGGGRHFSHPATEFIVEFPPGPLMVGNEQLHEWARVSVSSGTVQIITPTQSVKDRLAAFYHWNDRQCLDQAVMIGRKHNVDLDDIERWSRGEGRHDRFIEFRAALRGAKV